MQIDIRDLKFLAGSYGTRCEHVRGGTMGVEKKKGNSKVSARVISQNYFLA